MSQRVRVHLNVPLGRILLAPGEYVIGRSPECQIVLSNARASRRHARIFVDDYGATIEDLGSANGVFVNGTQLGRERRSLVKDDFVVIGDQALDVAIEPLGEEQFQEDRRPAPVSGPPTVPPHAVTTKAHALDLLANVAERALNGGYPERAERALDDWLHTTLQAARSGKPSEPHINELALKFSLKLAMALESSRWVDYALQLLSELRQPMNGALAGYVDTAIESVGAQAAWLDAYAAKLGTLPATPDQRSSLAHVQRWRAAMRSR